MNAHPPRILVLLASWNGATWITGQIQSILLQDRVDLRLIVRDDASTDTTADTVQRLANCDSRIVLRQASEPSGSAAQNFFCLIRDSDAHGFDYIALSDQDDTWYLDKLSKAVDALSASADCCGYSSATTAVWPDGTTRLLAQNPHPTRGDFLFEGAGQGCTFVLTANFFNRVQSFLRAHESLTRHIHFHDWTIYALARAWGLGWHFDPRSCMEYRQHGGNDTGARSSIQGIAARLNRIRRGWYRQQLLQIATLAQEAAPDDPDIKHWNALLHSPATIRRRAATAGFSLQHGRRRRIDTAILALSAILGWL